MTCACQRRCPQPGERSRDCRPGSARRGRSAADAAPDRARDRREAPRHRSPRPGRDPHPRRLPGRPPGRADRAVHRGARTHRRARHLLLPRRRARAPPAGGEGNPAGLPDRRPLGGARGRCAVHRPHHPQRHRGPVRVRPARARAAGGAGRPRPPRAADPARLRRQEPAHRARRARERPAFRGRRRRPHRPSHRRLGALVDLYPPTGLPRRRHLLSISDLDRADVERLLETAEGFESVMQRDVKKVPTLRGRTVVNLFFESSTRTSSSFELAAKRLHPTQSLLDLYTIRKALGKVEGLQVAIVGDVLHSRVARSNIQALTMLGAHVTLVGPPTLIPREAAAMGVTVSHSIDDIAGVDVIYVLRMQRERMLEGANYVPSLREYGALWGVTPDRVRPSQLVMHPGPINRGVEISAEVADSASSRIVDQVRAGLVTRMAVLYDLLTEPTTTGGQAALRAVEPAGQEVA